MSDLFSVDGHDLLDRVPLPGPYAARVQSLRRLIEDLEEEIDLFARLVRGRLVADPGYTALQQLPGVGQMLAAVFLAEVGDVDRFGTAPQLACWAGLTPKHHESDTHVHRGRITKQGSRLVRWAAVESVKRVGPHTRVGAVSRSGSPPGAEQHRDGRGRPQPDRVRLLRAARPPRPRAPPAAPAERGMRPTELFGRSRVVQVMTPVQRTRGEVALLIDPDRPNTPWRAPHHAAPAPPPGAAKG